MSVMRVTCCLDTKGGRGRAGNQTHHTLCESSPRRVVQLGSFRCGIPHTWRRVGRAPDRDRHHA
jgi:hypothetical protein